MEFIKEKNLNNILKKPTFNKADLAILDLNINKAKLNSIFKQFASFILELLCLEFLCIRAISKDVVSKEWTVTKLLLTYNINKVVSFADFSVKHFTTMLVFNCLSNYFIAHA
jgi:hypothetical protein